MATNIKPSSDDVDRQWFIIGRWQEYEGEARANLLRIIGIAAFYIVELVNYYGFQLGFVEIPKVVDLPFHQAITALAVGWAVLALGLQLCLTQRIFPAILKFISTGLDIVFLTSILMVAHGPRSPLIVGYLLIIVLATLRFNLSLIRFATLGSMAGYLFLLGYAKWFTGRDLHVPRFHQIIFLIALAMTGVVLGQVIRRVHGLAKDYAARLEANKEEDL